MEETKRIKREKIGESVYIISNGCTCIGLGIWVVKQCIIQ